MTGHTLVIKPNGDMKCLYAEALPLRALGALNISRGSFVEPTAQGYWTADLAPVDGPVLGPYERRSDALLAETEWLKSHYLAGDAS